MLYTHSDQPGDNIFRVVSFDNILMAEMIVELGTQAEVAAQFPKGSGVRPRPIRRETLHSTRTVPAGLTAEEEWAAVEYETVGTAYICAQPVVNSSKMTRAGCRRFQSFLAKAEQLGYKVEWVEPGQSFGERQQRLGGGQYTVGNHCRSRVKTEALLDRVAA